MTQLRPTVALIALCFAGAASGPAAAEPRQISPGYWETTNQMLSPIRQTKVERRCIRPADVAKFMNGPSNHIYNCTYPTRRVEAGAIHLKGSCATRDGPPIPVTGEGTFTADTFKFDAHIAAKLGPMTIPVHARTDARRLSPDCPSETASSSPSPSSPSSSDSSAQKD